MSDFELLSPGGTLEKIKFALEYGADAVYTGYKRFGLRSRAGNLDLEQIREAVKFVHSREKRLYLTLNSYLFDRELDELYVFLDKLESPFPDAFIVSDLGVLSIVREVLPEIPIHISTQANITNSKAANMLEPFGVSRIVLARELSIEDIKRFCSSSRLETEAFIHGAMCMAYSGRCFLSAYMSSRSANSGDCAQSCRWRYRLIEEKRPNEPLTVEEHPEGSFIFNAYDMCALPVLDKLMDAGVYSFKIEGRMKSLYYVAIVTSVYRRAIDEIVRAGKIKDMEFYMAELQKVSHRPYSTGFYEGRPSQYVYSSGYIRDCEFVGVVEGYEGGRLLVNVRNRLEPGEYELVACDGSVEKLNLIEFEDEEGNQKTVGNPNDFLYIKCHAKAHRGVLRRCAY